MVVEPSKISWLVSDELTITSLSSTDELRTLSQQRLAVVSSSSSTTTINVSSSNSSRTAVITIYEVNCKSKIIYLMYINWCHALGQQIRAVITTFTQQYLPRLATQLNVQFSAQPESYNDYYKVLFVYDKDRSCYYSDDSKELLSQALITKYVQSCEIGDYRYDWKSLLMLATVQVGDSRFQQLAMQLLVYDLEGRDLDYFNSVLKSYCLK